MVQCIWQEYYLLRNFLSWQFWDTDLQYFLLCGMVSYILVSKLVLSLVFKIEVIPNAGSTYPLIQHTLSIIYSRGISGFMHMVRKIEDVPFGLQWYRVSVIMLKKNINGFVNKIKYLNFIFIIKFYTFGA
jgi:hypothetical protein